MIAISNTKELSQNVKVLSQLVAQTNVPILSFIKIEVRDSKMRLTSTNLETTIMITVQCSSDKEELFLVPSREFARVLSSMEDKIEIRVEKNILVKDNKINFVLRSSNVNDYPEEPEINLENVTEIPSEALHKLITSIIFNAAKDDMRPMLNGINIKFEEGNISMVATDGKRLGINSQNIKDINISQEFTIPSNTLSFLLHLINTEEERMSVSYNDTFCFFKQENITVIATKLQGEYPNVSDIVKNLDDKCIEIDRKLTIESLNRLSIFANKVNNLVKWRVIGNKIKMQTMNDYGKGYLNLDIKNPFAQNYEVGFNYLYMLEILKAMPDDVIYFYYKDSTSPLAIKTKEYPAIYIVMPIKIRGDNEKNKENR